MLDLDGPPALESCNVTVSREAERVPEAHGRLHAKLVLEGPERRRGVQRPVAPRRASEPVLEEHPDDSHHRQPAICYLGRELLLFLRWVTGREHLEPEVPLRTWGPWGLVLRELAEGAVRQDLPPTSQWHLGDRPQAVRDVGKLQAHRRGEVARELARELRRDVAHGSEHGDPPVLDLSLPTPREVLRVAVGRETEGVPEAYGRLHAELVLEGPERRRGVQRPIAPCRASEPVLEEHPDDGHHCQPAICYLGCELLLFLRWVTGRENLEPEVPLRTWGPWGLVLRELAEGAVCQDLPPTGQRHLGD